MFESKSTEHLAFMSRQLSGLLENDDLDGALSTLQDASPKQYANEIHYLQELLTGSNAADYSLGPNPYRLLAKLMPEVRGSENQLFRGFVDYVRQSKVLFETYWSGVVGMTWYLAALSIVMIIVSVVFSIFVIPSFESMFAQHHAALPSLTQTVFTLGGIGLPLFAIVLGAFVALVVWFVATFHRRIQQMEPLPRWHSSLPIIGRVSEYYNFGLFLNICRLLMDSRVASGAAVDIAAKVTGQPAGVSIRSLHDQDGDYSELPIFAELAIAEKLGNFRNEIDHQCGDHIGKMSTILVQARDKFSLVLKLLLYVFVATLVIAMYLPIFKMGSVL